VDLTLSIDRSLRDQVVLVEAHRRENLRVRRKNHFDGSKIDTEGGPLCSIDPFLRQKNTLLLLLPGSSMRRNS